MVRHIRIIARRQIGDCEIQTRVILPGSRVYSDIAAWCIRLDMAGIRIALPNRVLQSTTLRSGIVCRNITTRRTAFASI